MSLFVKYEMKKVPSNTAYFIVARSAYRFVCYHDSDTNEAELRQVLQAVFRSMLGLTEFTAVETREQTRLESFSRFREKRYWWCS